MNIKNATDFTLCENCGCPRAVHHDDARCLHCQAFNAKEQCYEFIPQDNEFVVVNPLILRQFFLMMFTSGICIGIGLYGLTTKLGIAVCGIILGLGIMLGIICLRIIPKKEKNT